jgi:nitrous-oxide reductase
MARDDNDKTNISRRQVVGTAALGAAGVAGGFGLG